MHSSSSRQETRLEKLGNLVVPNAVANNIFAVDYSALSDQLGQPPHIVSDMDHVLRRPSGIVPEEVHDLISDQLREGTIASFSVATNNPFGHKAPGAEQFDRVFRAFIGRSGLVRKPEKRFFETIFDTLQAEPNECVMIGNNPFTDIYGGNLAGMTTVQVDPLGSNYVFEFCRQHRGRRLVRLGQSALAKLTTAPVSSA